MMRKRSKLSGILATVVITAAGGCMSPWASGRSASSSVSVVQGSSSVSQAAQLATTAAAESFESNASLEPNAGDLPKTTDEAMAAVLGELQQIGAVDPAAQQKLMADLRETKPEEWPRMVQQFQSALAFRDQLATKESQQIAQASTKSTAVTQVSSVVADSVYVQKGHAAAGKAGTVQPALAATVSQAQGFPQVAAAMLGNTTVSREALAKHLAAASPKPLPPTTLLPPLPIITPTALTNRKPTVLAAAERKKIERSSPTSSAVPTGTSQSHLQAAIASMEQSTPDPPSSVEDVQQQMRLRLLRLLAGQESAAMSPIPGASSTQQDYWSNQLFALSTYLDNKQQPDVKRRAAGSLIHLDSARASLAELATLNVRNLTFVDSVDGFGVYQEHEETKFRPGDQVMLYAEVENFRSQSSKEGFHTKLSTSYEVLDESGKRVDGAQFPDVEDLCRNQRRDFHMQYGVALPTHIYAGHYKLQLTITDQLSHKIGQTDVPFEIIE